MPCFFTEKLLHDLQEIPDSIELQLNRMCQEKSINIWGIGVGGQMICKSLRKYGIEADSFIDGSGKTVTKGSLMDIPIMLPESISPQAFIIIAADIKYGIHNQIREQYGNHFCYIDPLLFSQYTADHKKKVIKSLSSAIAEIDAVYERLRDEKSKKTLHNALIHRAVHRIDLLWDVIEYHQYFENDIVASAGGAFVDCGAFTGDTLKSFLSQLKDNEYHYYAFEPEKNNYSELQNYVKANKIPNVSLYNIGLWDRKAKLGFLENHDNDALAWKLDEINEETASEIAVDSLDNVLYGRRINYIKMDIEGSELKALEGSCKVIQEQTPKLAISAYHEMNHLWKVPLKIMELHPEYSLYFRHHSWNMADTVCYGI